MSKIISLIFLPENFEWEKYWFQASGTAIGWVKMELHVINLKHCSEDRIFSHNIVLLSKLLCLNSDLHGFMGLISVNFFIEVTLPYRTSDNSSSSVYGVSVREYWLDLGLFELNSVIGGNFSARRSKYETVISFGLSSEPCKALGVFELWNIF